MSLVVQVGLTVPSQPGIFNASLNDKRPVKDNQPCLCFGLGDRLRQSEGGLAVHPFAIAEIREGHGLAAELD